MVKISKKIIIISGLMALALLISSCNMPVQGINPSTVGETIVVEPSSQSQDTSKKGEVKQFEMTAKRFEFNPDTIMVNQGDIVKITITSLDVVHGFSINEYGINEMISPGQPTVIEFTADKKGTFTFYCSVPCGSGHSHMSGTLIVK